MPHDGYALYALVSFPLLVLDDIRGRPLFVASFYDILMIDDDGHFFFWVLIWLVLCLFVVVVVFSCFSRYQDRLLVHIDVEQI